MISKEKRVVDFYVLCNRLKNVIRSGWKYWNIKRNRVESIADHIYGVEMLAVAMASEYEYDIDLKKVIFMIAVHELGETIIGDYAMFEISKEEKAKIEHEAIHKILSGLLNGPKIESLLLEFDKRETKEAIFAYQCDKLECDIQCKLYDEEGCVDLSEPDKIEDLKIESVRKIFEETHSWSATWVRNSMAVANYDENFKAIIDYILNNEISEK